MRHCMARCNNSAKCVATARSRTTLEVSGLTCNSDLSKQKRCDRLIQIHRSRHTAQQACLPMDAHKAVLLEALAGLSELDFPMQDILDLQLQVVLLRHKAVAQQPQKQTQPELKAINVQQGIHLDHCQAHLTNALDKFNTYLLGFLVARGCEKLRKELGGPQDQQTWDDWLDHVPEEMLASLHIPPEMKNLLKVSGYAAAQTAEMQPAETHEHGA